MPKLTEYFVDMGVLLVEVRDGRTGRNAGLGYVKVKRYIVNGLLSEFEERVEIVAAVEKGNKKNVIGEIIVKLAFSVPMNIPPQFLQFPQPK